MMTPEEALYRITKDWDREQWDLVAAEVDATEEANRIWDAIDRNTEAFIAKQQLQDAHQEIDKHPLAASKLLVPSSFLAPSTQSDTDGPKVRIGDHVIGQGKTLSVCLWYPRSDNEFNEVEIDLVDVRAADSIRVTYDFDKDGWSITQGSYNKSTPEVGPIDWKEVAFVPAWGREIDPKGNEVNNEHVYDLATASKLLETLKRENDRLRTGMMVEGDYVMSDASRIPRNRHEAVSMGFQCLYGRAEEKGNATAPDPWGHLEKHGLKDNLVGLYANESPSYMKSVIARGLGVPEELLSSEGHALHQFEEQMKVLHTQLITRLQKRLLSERKLRADSSERMIAAARNILFPRR
jgi:hypothetical protein